MLYEFWKRNAETKSSSLDNVQWTSRYDKPFDIIILGYSDKGLKVMEKLKERPKTVREHLCLGLIPIYFFSVIFGLLPMYLIYYHWFIPLNLLQYVLDVGIFIGISSVKLDVGIFMYSILFDIYHFPPWHLGLFVNCFNLLWLMSWIVFPPQTEIWIGCVPHQVWAGQSGPDIRAVSPPPNWRPCGRTLGPWGRSGKPLRNMPSPCCTFRRNGRQSHSGNFQKHEWTTCQPITSFHASE